VADNTTLNTGSGGDVIATDDIGGVKHQLVKVEFGAADSATQVSASNPLPVASYGVAAQDAAVSGNPVLTAGRASAAVPTDVSADGDVVTPWLLRSGAQAVQETYAGVLAVAGNGASGTGVQRVTLANDS